METLYDQTRRALVTSLAGLSLGAGATTPSAGAERKVARTASPILAAYFSRTGNTRVVAGLIQRALGADVFEIRPALPYPEDYLATVEKARQERDLGSMPALKEKVPDVAVYTTVFLGFPIWGETAPPVIRSFLSAHDLAGKTLVPFITHGRYGPGDSHAVVARHAPGAIVRPGFSMQADQERDTMDLVNGWLKAAGRPR